MQTSLYEAVRSKRFEIGIFLVKRGAVCTEAEIARLGRKYTRFVAILSERKISFPPPSNSPRPAPRVVEQSSTSADSHPPGAIEITNASNEEMAEFRATLMQKDKLLISKDEEIEERKRKDEKQQMEILRLTRIVAKLVNSLEEFSSIHQSKLNPLTFRCTAANLETDFMVKILANKAISETAEIELLKSLPPHPNVVQILHEFQSVVPPAFLDLLPREYVATENMNQRVQCYLLSCFESLEDYLSREFKHLSVPQKLKLIVDVIEILRFLFDQNIVHRDLSLQNLLFDAATGNVILSNFRWAIRLTSEKTCTIAADGWIGGNTEHLAPELRRISTRSEVLVDYSKQPSFELGMLAHEIYFGKQPDEYTHGESMYLPYFNNLCPDDSHKISEVFEWMKLLLFANPKHRITFVDAVEKFHSFYWKY